MIIKHKFPAVKFIHESHCLTEKIMPFSGYPHVITLKRGESKTITVPVNSSLAEFKRYVIGPDGPSPKDRRDEKELKKLEKLRQKSPMKIPIHPSKNRFRRGVLNRLEK